MRIDREAFLLAVTALAGCERADPSPTRARPVATASAPRAGMAAHFQPSPTPEPPPPPARPEPIAEVTPEPIPVPTSKQTTAHHRRHQSAAKTWFLGLT